MGYCRRAARKPAISGAGRLVSFGEYSPLRGAKGDKHASCAQKCLTGGMPAGILADGKLWVATMKDHSAPNAKLAPMAGKTVTATGTEIEKNGTHIFEIDTVEAAAK